MTDIDQHEIDAMKAADDFVGLGKKVQELFKLPQSLCKVRGNCCKVATFKGTLSYQAIQDLANSENEDAQNAREFLTLFEPYATEEEVLAIAPGFVAKVREKCASDSEPVGYFKCRFLGEAGQCLIHEDRPTGCRVFPFPHENTIYHPGCGFEQRGLENWRKIQDITQFYEDRFNQIQAEIVSQEQLMQSAVEHVLHLEEESPPATD